MSDPDTSAKPSNIGLEDLLERRSPSAVDRHDAALRDAGVAPADIAASRGAIASLAAAATGPDDAPSSVRARILASQERAGASRYGIFADRVARMFDLSVSEAESLLRSLEDPASWRPFLAAGLELMPVTGGPKCASSIATFVRIQPGTSFPHHAHRGEETMLVLDGGFRETAEGGEEAWRGDEVVRDDGTEHTLLGLPGVPCVAAVVIHGVADFD